MNEEWREFGWQGIRALVPSDCEIGAISGDHKRGYIRLDDSVMPRVEFKWASQKKKPDLAVILDEYFKGLRKQSRKSHDQIRIKRNVSLLKPGEIPKEDVTFFNWKSGRVRAFGMAWYCHECKRTLIAQYSGFSGESIRSDASRLFTSISDHPEGSDSLWTAYRMAVEIPRRYSLESYKMMSAYLLLSFADGSRRIAVERYGLADVLLKSDSIESWFRRTYRKAMKGYGFEIRESRTDDEHAELVVEGEKSRVTDVLPISPLFLLDKIVRRRRIFVRVRYCERSNRIYAVRAITKVDPRKIVDGVSSSIVCHEG